MTIFLSDDGSNTDLYQTHLEIAKQIYNKEDRAETWAWNNKHGEIWVCNMVKANVVSLSIQSIN